MGSKIKTFFLCLIVLFSLSCHSYVFAYPSNAMVNVGIMDAKYTTVEKTSVDI